MSFWADNLQPAAPELPRGDGAAYRAERRQQSASLIYAERAQGPQASQSRYVDATKPLESYAAKTASPLDQRPGEPFGSYERRLGRIAQHLPDGEAEARLEAAKSAEQAWSWEAHRNTVDNRTGTGTGIFGNASPTERAAALGSRGFGGEQQLQALGHLAADSTIGDRPKATAVDVNVILGQQEARLQQQRFAATAALRSSGSSWL